MNERVDAAAKATAAYAEAWCADFAGVLELGERTNEHMVGLGQAALAAADAVMFSDEAVERAAQKLALPFTLGKLAPSAQSRHRTQVQNVIAALKGDES